MFDMKRSKDSMNKEELPIFNEKLFLIGVSIIFGIPGWYFVNQIIINIVFVEDKSEWLNRIIIVIFYLLAILVAINLITISIKGSKNIGKFFTVTLLYCGCYFFYYLNLIDQNLRYEYVSVWFYFFAIGSFCSLLYYILLIFYTLVKEGVNKFLSYKLDPKDKLTLVVMFFGTVISLIALFK